jgi:hypothetical protein
MAAPSGAVARAGHESRSLSALSADELGVKNQGVGTYTDASVANQISNFSINPRMVSCGVGTIAYGTWTGPFAMLMYAVSIRSYHVDRKTSTIRATGTMRSITTVGGNVMEDVRHRFLAIAVDGKGKSPDRFDVYMRTPFWNTGSNPMCTASTQVSGGCRFGGRVIMGGVEAG